MTLRNDKVQGIEIWKFLKQTFELSIKTFCRKWEGKTFPKWLVIYKQLDKCHNEYYADNSDLISFCRRFSFHLIMFPITLLKGICDHIENDKLLKGKFGHFS